MSINQKIELANYTSDKHFRLYARFGNAKIPDNENINFADQIIRKIKELETEEKKMSNKKDGGPAFPIKIELDHEEQEIYSGMSLRDYFAGKAMQGILSDPNFKMDTQYAGEELAESCYSIADAMLKERDK